MSIPRVLQIAIASCLSIFYSGAVLLSMIIHPIQFVKGFFNRRKRDTAPECLNDPSLGSHSYIHLEDVRLHYVANGEEGKPLMLFVHGFPEFWYSWRFQLREFAKDYRVVAFDMRGYSESDKPSGVNSYKTEKLIGDIKQLIPALGYHDCVVVGHDWGGSIVFSFATAYPEMVKRVVVLNCPYPPTFYQYLQSSWKQFKKSWYMFFFQMPYLPEIVFSHNDFKSLEGMFSDKSIKNIKPEDVEAYKYAFFKGGFTGPINFYRAAFRRNPADIKKFAKKIDVPTLIVWGKKDLALNWELAELAKEYVSDLTIKYVENGTHWVQMDEPEETNLHMREFLKVKDTK